MQSAILFYRFCPSVRLMTVLYLNEWTYRHSFVTTLSFLSPITVTKFHRKPPSGGGKYTGVWKFAIFDRNRRLSRKLYEIGPRLLWIKVVCSRSIHASSSDFVWLCKRSIFFRRISIITFGLTTQVKKHILVGQPRPHPNGRGPSVPKNFWIPIYAQTVWPRATKFGMITRMRE